MGGDLSHLGAHDEHRLVADRVLHVVAGCRDLLLAAGDLPGPRPQPFVLEIEEAALRVPLLRHEAVGTHPVALLVAHPAEPTARRHHLLAWSSTSPTSGNASPAP